MRAWHASHAWWCPGCPTIRRTADGNRRQQTFFREEDYQAYLDLMGEWCLAGRDDHLVRVAPLLAQFGDWAEFLSEGLSPEQAELIRRHERTGRPLGSEGFVARLEGLLAHVLHPQKRGPKGRRKRKPRN